MAKEEMKERETQEIKPMDVKEVTAYANMLQERLKEAYKDLREAKKELALYQMQDYYQRAQLLLSVLDRRSSINNQNFLDFCEKELMRLVFPPEPNDGDENPKE